MNKLILIALLALSASCGKEEMNCKEIDSITGNFPSLLTYRFVDGSTHFFSASEKDDFYKVGDFYCGE